MIRHLFTMIWNKKKKNFLMITEIFVSFLVLFAIFSLIVFNINNYRKPAGFDYENVWAINFSLEDSKRDSMANYHKPVENLLRSTPEVKDFSWTSENFPYSMSSSNNQVSYKKARVSAEIHHAGDSYHKVIGTNMVEGRWFQREDDGLKDQVIVINEALKEALFKDESPLGKIINADEHGGDKIIGVVATMKEKGDFQANEPSFYRRISTTDSNRYEHIVLIKLASEQGAEFEARLHKQLSKLLYGANIEIEYLAEMRKDRNNLTIVPVTILLIISAFLVLNVSLGLFGILWYNINSRKSEIGLRRAVGATSNNISWHFIAEAMVLTTLALTVGLFFAIQFPLLNVFDIAAGVYLSAILLSVLFIYVLVLICAFYPGRQAAGIYPATALHED